MSFDINIVKVEPSNNIDGFARIRLFKNEDFNNPISTRILASGPGQVTFSIKGGISPNDTFLVEIYEEGGNEGAMQ